MAYIGAAFVEIGGWFALWAWARMGKSIWWLPLGRVLLIILAYLLTLVDSEAAGRAHAAYDGVYIIAWLIWLWMIEGVRPDCWDLTGAFICLIGTSVILLGPRIDVIHGPSCGEGKGGNLII